MPRHGSETSLIGTVSEKNPYPCNLGMMFLFSFISERNENRKSRNGVSMISSDDE